MEGTTLTQKNVALLALAALSAAALLCLRLGGSPECAAVEEWMEAHSLGGLRDVLVQAGGSTSIHGALNVMQVIKKNKKLKKSLTADQLDSLSSAVEGWRRMLEMECWLKDLGVEGAVPLFHKQNIRSLHDLSELSDQEVTSTLTSLRLPGWDTHLSHQLTAGLTQLRTAVAKHQPLVASQAFHSHVKGRDSTSSRGNLIATTCLASLLLTSLAMLLSGLPTPASLLLPAAKTSIYEYLTGRYHHPHTSRVTWDWPHHTTVGKTLNFGVRFFQRSGAPYPVSDGDGVLVEIVHEGVKVACSLEFSGDCESDVNLVRCSFTVHKSGDYKISVLVGGRHITGSPYLKSFLPGPIEPTKSGFTHYTSTVVCPAGTSYPLVIETRDAFGNPSAYKADNKAFFKIKVLEAGSGDRYSPTTQIVYNTTDKKLVMHIKMEKEGCYSATVSYGDVRLKNGEFDILVLGSSELTKVQKNVAKRKHNLWYEARLHSYNGETLDKPKKVYVYISPKQLTIKEFYFKIYPRKLCTFRVNPWTKFAYKKSYEELCGFSGSLSSSNKPAVYAGQWLMHTAGAVHDFVFNTSSHVTNDLDLPRFSIDDGSQPPVEVAARERNTIIATFSCFLLKNIGGSETFNDKRNFFYQEIRATHNRRSHSTLPLKVERFNLFESSYRATRSLHMCDWCKRFEITFVGEQGLDWGGVSREWFECLATDMFDPSQSQLFVRLTDNPQGLVHPNPKRPPDKKLKHYEFCGKLVGKCLYESSLSRTQLVKARFSRSFLAQLIGLRVTYKHFITDDPDFFTTKISYIEHHDVDDMELTFSEEVYSPQGQLLKTVDLVPNGSRVPVTNSNKLRYLDALAQYRLVTPVKEEVEAFLRGLTAEIIPENLLSIFDENELELLMCGTSTYSISDFKLHHNIVGASPNFNKVRDWFWTIIASFTEEQLSRLLQFITGCSQLPPGGFSELCPKVQLSSAPTYNMLPSSHTCFNQLCLPDYDSMDTFHKMLLTAINEGNQGFGLS